MRRIRAAGAAMLLCLGSGGAPAAAPADAVAMMATQECDFVSEPVQCTYTASGPRVAGPGRHVFSQVAPGRAVTGSDEEAWVAWTHARIDGPRARGPATTASSSTSPVRHTTCSCWLGRLPTTVGPLSPPAPIRRQTRTRLPGRATIDMILSSDTVKVTSRSAVACLSVAGMTPNPAAVRSSSPVESTPSPAAASQP